MRSRRSGWWSPTGCSWPRSCSSAVRWETTSVGAGSLRSASRCSRRPRSPVRCPRTIRTAHHGARGAGRGCRASGAGQPGAHQCVLPCKGAGPSDRHLVWVQRNHGRPRPGAGGLPGRSLLMGVGVSSQRAAGDRRTRDHLAACSREPRRFRRRWPGRLGGAAGDRCARRHRVRIHRSADATMGLAGRARRAARRRRSGAGVRRGRTARTLSDVAAAACFGSATSVAPTCSRCCCMRP